MKSPDNVAQAIGVWLLATVIVVALAATLVLAVDIVLLIFLGVLFSVFLAKTSRQLGKLLPTSYGWNLAIVTTLLFVLLGASIAIFGVKIENRLKETSKQLDNSAQQVRSWLDHHPLAQSVFEQIPFVKRLALKEDEKGGKQQEDKVAQSAEDPQTDGSKSDAETSSGNSGDVSSLSTKTLKSAAGTVFSIVKEMMFTSLGIVTNVGIVLFVGLFIAVNPGVYRVGIAKLFPLDKRERVHEVMDKMGNSLFSWLMGRFMTMAITGGGAAAVLFFLGVPMPITIGVITGLLTFIPNIGGLIALLLAMLMAVPQGISTVMWVVGLYAALQLLESNVITPLLQQHQTSIPPALLISVQILVGALTGFLGLMVATPALAAGMVLVQEVWVKDTLGDYSQAS